MKEAKSAAGWREGFEAGYAEAWRAAVAWGVVRVTPKKARKTGVKRPPKK
jgi:hypothetical protein